MAAFDRTRNELRLAALAELQAELHLRDLVSAEHGDSVGRQGDVAPAAFCLWRLHSQPAGSGFLERSVDGDDRTVEINVGPLESQELAAPHAGRQCKGGNRLERVASQRL